MKPKLPRLTWSQALAWRASQHFLVDRSSDSAFDNVVSRIGGLHAQVLSSAELSAWARMERLERGAVQRALWEDRTLVKTWAMRGTLHLLPASEYGLWQSALGSFRHYLKPGWLRSFGVTLEQLEQLTNGIAAALEGRLLTRDELAQEVVRVTGAPDLGDKVRQSWGSLLKPAAYRGCLCFAPGVGQNVRFTHPASWLNPWRAVTEQEAMKTMARRYLAAYGPATRVDFAHWFGLTPAMAGQWIHELGDEAVQVDVEGSVCWMLAESVKAARTTQPSRTIRLLPAFDPYVIAASPHCEFMFDGDHKARIYRPQGWLTPVILVDGRMAGVWEWERKGKRVVVELEPFGRATKWLVKGAEREASRLAAWLGGELDLQLK